MFLKPSVLLSCFVLVGLISCNLATPALRFRRETIEETPQPENFAESVKQLTNEIGKSVKNLVENSPWIYNNFVTIGRTTVEKGFQNLASWFVDMGLRMELFMMADGSHFYFPLNGKSEIEQDYKTVAIAVSKLMMNLKTMERTDAVLKNVTGHLLTEDVEPHLKELKASSEKIFRTILHLYFEKLDHQLEADEELRGAYQQWKTEARGVVKRDPKMRDAFIKRREGPPSYEDIETFLVDKKIYRQAIVNKMFMKQSVKHFTMVFSRLHYQRYLLARALIQKARSSSSDSKINEIYHQALVRAAELSVQTQEDDLENVLFKSIESGLESEPKLNAEVRTLMNQIEGSTVYDTDMFHVDFSVV